VLREERESGRVEVEGGGSVEVEGEGRVEVDDCGNREGGLITLKTGRGG